MAIKLRNQGQRKIQFGATAEESIAPLRVVIVDDKTGKILLSLYPDELVDLDNLKIDYKAKDVKDFSKTKSAGEPLAAKAAGAEKTA